MDLLARLKDIPEVVWGMAAGSFFSVIAVVLTNRSNLRRLKIQLDHDREEKRKDRDLVLRQDLYLEAAAVVSAGVDAVGALGDLSKSVEALIGPTIEKTAAISKVYLVASEDTIIALAHLIQELSNTYARLLPLRMKVEALNGEISHIDRTLERVSGERDQTLAVMERYKLAGSSAQDRWVDLHKSLESGNTRMDDLLRRRKELGDQLLPAQVDLLKSCQAEVRKLNTLLVPVLKSIRHELDIPLNEDVLIGVIEEEYRIQSAHIDDLLEEAAAARDTTRPGANDRVR